jgi:nicotinate-nucleotide adenylyltransferase
VNIGLFGGTFDPIHIGHVRAAQAAERRFRLDRVLFVPSGVPPHKSNGEVTPFPHRFAMVALAARGRRAFVPSLLEEPRTDGRPNYSVETVSAVRSLLRRNDRLYFILGIDSFLDLPNWKDYERLSELTDFVVVARPGFGSRELLAQIGDGYSETVFSRAGSSLRLPSGAGVHVLSTVRTPVASREIRHAAAAGESLAGLVPPLVEEYIAKEDLYRPAGAGRRPGRGGE